MNPPYYQVVRIDSAPAANEPWNGPTWSNVPAIEISHFHARSSEHHPKTRAKLAYTDQALHLHYLVEDQYVLARHTEPQDMVCRDSCVEFFVRPRSDQGYFNFEMNCGGTLLLQYHTVPRQGGPLEPTWLQRVKIEHTMPSKVTPERTEPTPWRLAATIPLQLFESRIGPLAQKTPGPGVSWEGAFYKCADQSSHPHWGSWTPLADKCDFHNLEQFGELRFA